MLKTLGHKAGAAYDDDLYLWSQEQARLLREGRFAELDLVNLADEVESVGDRTSAKSKAASTSSSLIS